MLAMLVAGAVVASGRLTPPLAAQSSARPPVLEVDTSWPKTLPNGWSVGPVSGITADASDHILIVQRAEPVRQAGGRAAPPVIEFDPNGNVVRTWGGPGPGYEWPEQVHGITIDYKDRVWISGNGPKDAHILAFRRDGTFLLQIGHSGKSGGSNDTENLGHATQMRIDPQTNEVFVSDGENGNHRVIVFDSDTGAYKRHWGAYGTKPDDSAATAKFDPSGPPPKQFGSATHCLRIARDGLVYACDRSNNRFQIFRKDGTFVKELFIAKETAAATVWDIDFSPDQRFMYVADGGNQKVWILQRDSLQIAGELGGPGKEAGRFATSLHDIVVDSKGNLYTGEAATGGRVQKFRNTVSVAGQAQKPAANPAPQTESAAAARALVRAKAASKNWKVARTAWGEPDLQGVWSYATTTPLSKPGTAGEKTFLTDEEVAELADQTARIQDAPPRPGDPGTYNNFWWDRGQSIGRTSLIIDPEDGTLPALTPEAQKARADRVEYQRAHPADSWLDRSPTDRCIMYHGVPPLPSGYNNTYQIFQTPGMVAILDENIHHVRLIPLDGRPHLGQNVRQWNGDSRGHWEGTTLVVETTNFNDKTRLRYGGSENTHAVERFTRVSEDWIDYQYTITDPTVYTKPFTVAIPMPRRNDRIYEYACHEGNHSMVGILSGARADEKRAEEAAKAKEGVR